MILIDKADTIVTIAVSVDDMNVQPTNIVLTNLQTKEVNTYNVYDVRTNERTAIYKFYNVRVTQPTPQQNITYIQLEDGTYNYKLGNEIGLFQVGIPTLLTTVYNGQNNNNDVYYNG